MRPATRASSSRSNGSGAGPSPPQQPHPPVLVGGHGPTVLDRVLAFGDGWFPNYGEDVLERIAGAARPRRRGDDRPDGPAGRPARRSRRAIDAGARRALLLAAVRRRSRWSSRLWSDGSSDRRGQRRGVSADEARGALRAGARRAAGDRRGRRPAAPRADRVRGRRRSAGDVIYSVVDAKPKRTTRAAAAGERRRESARQRARRPLRGGLDALWWVRADGRGRLFDDARA